jgi:hypothetical protein
VTSKVIASVFGLIVLGGTAAAVSRFVSRKERPKAYECKVVLRDILWAQRAYREQHGVWADTFSELGFKLDKPTRYTYFLSDSLGPRDVKLPPLPVAPGARGDGFVAACAANLDADDTLDVWSVGSADGETVHVTSDD